MLLRNHMIPPMKCTRCKAPAQHKFPSHNLKLCADCLEVFMQRHVAKAIEKYRMIKPGERVLLGVSGGKDSLAAWKVLKELGHDVTAVHFNLNFGEFSQRSIAACQAMARRLGYELEVVNLPQQLGLEIQELAWANKRGCCAVCGTVKRYYFNILSERGGYDCVATGHNINDEAARLLGNTIQNQVRHLRRHWPVIPASPDGYFKRKIKPLFFISESEIKAYVKLHSLPVLDQSCPQSKGATSAYYKAAMDKLELDMPGIRRGFMARFLKERQEPPAQLIPGNCKECGYPSLVEHCNFCVLMERGRAWKAEKQAKAAALERD